MADNKLNTLEIVGEDPPVTTLEPEVTAIIVSGPAPVGAIDEIPDSAAKETEIKAIEERAKKAREDAKYWTQEKARRRADYFKDRKPLETPAATPKTTIEKPDPEKFTDYNDYVEALTDWKVEAKKEEWDRDQGDKAKQETHQEKMSSLQAKIGKGYTKYDDFEEVAMDESVPITPMVMEVLAESENPADVAYYLGKNRMEAIKISRLTPIGAAREIARIEGEIKATAATATAATTTQAPAPIIPVGSTGAAVSKDPNKMTQAEYEKWRESEGARRY